MEVSRAVSRQRRTNRCEPRQKSPNGLGVWLKHRRDWKKHKKEVLNAGHVHLVGKLVGPFLEVEDSVEL
jgi:hypothetical protein